MAAAIKFTPRTVTALSQAKVARSLCPAAEADRLLREMEDVREPKANVPLSFVAGNNWWDVKIPRTDNVGELEAVGIQYAIEVEGLISNPPPEGPGVYTGDVLALIAGSQVENSTGLLERRRYDAVIRGFWRAIGVNLCHLLAFHRARA